MERRGHEPSPGPRLDAAGQQVAIMRQSGGKWRAVIEDKLWLPFRSPELLPAAARRDGPKSACSAQRLRPAAASGTLGAESLRACTSRSYEQDIRKTCSHQIMRRRRLGPRRSIAIGGSCMRMCMRMCMCLASVAQRPLRRRALECVKLVPQLQYLLLLFREFEGLALGDLIHGLCAHSPQALKSMRGSQQGALSISCACRMVRRSKTTV